MLLAKTFNAFGAEEVAGEPHYHKHIRNIAINWACQAHLEACVSSTQDKFRDFKEGKRAGFTSDHESSIFCNGLLMGDEEDFDFMWSLFSLSRDTSRRNLYLEAMGCFENEEILTKFVHTILESDAIDSNSDEWLTIMQAVYRSGPIGLRVALKFLRANCDAFIGL